MYYSHRIYFSFEEKGINIKGSAMLAIPKIK
jgi:hypothetical protein